MKQGENENEDTRRVCAALASPCRPHVNSDYVRRSRSADVIITSTAVHSTSMSIMELPHIKDAKYSRLGSTFHLHQ